MKALKTIFLAFFLILINVSSVFAKTPPAPPVAARSAAAIPPPPDGPIDQNLILLLVSALIFGVYTIYTYNEKRKASI